MRGVNWQLEMIWVHLLWEFKMQVATKLSSDTFSLTAAQVRLLFHILPKLVPQISWHTPKMKTANQMQ